MSTSFEDNVGAEEWPDSIPDLRANEVTSGVSEFTLAAAILRELETNQGWEAGTLRADEHFTVRINARSMARMMRNVMVDVGIVPA